MAAFADGGGGFIHSTSERTLRHALLARLALQNVQTARGFKGCTTDIGSRYKEQACDDESNFSQCP